MASGVGLSKSEPRKRVVASRLRTDPGDVSSLSSMPFENRPNNWDFSDWRPASTLDTGKRIKKDNPEKEKEKEWQRELERVRERVRAGSPADKERSHTPATFPRTRMTPGMLPSQRLALENLRQRMTFSDAEEAGGEVDSNQECHLNMLAVAEDHRYNLSPGAQRNSMSEEPPDSSQIVGRLMQIRDYIKQASTMMLNLQRSTDQSDQSRAVQLQLVVTRLRDQEQKYLDLLLRITAPETGTDTGMEETTGAEDSESEAASVDLDVRSMQSDATDNTTDVASESRPVIEERLGRHSDTDMEELTSARSSRSHTSTSLERATQLASHKQHLQADLVKKNDELEALREQHDLLKKMLYQQEQLRALQGRQAALQALQEDAERKLQEEQANSAAGASAATPAEEAAEADQALIPSELQDLRSRLNYFKNIYDITEQVEETSTASAAPASELSMMSLERRQLEDKLTDLQQKKSQMDSLLSELQSLRGTQDIGNDGGSATSSQDHLAASLTASVLANRTAAEAQDMLDVLESRKKLHKLQEVRERLNQLRDLVQYYQSGTEFIHGTQQSLPMLASTNNLSPSNTNFRDKQSRQTVAGKFKQYGEGTLTSASESVNASEVASTSQNDSDTESNLSSTIGAWGDDPGVRTKVHKLKAAKEKLHRLQELVAMVQESPDLMTVLPEHLAQLASSLDSSGSGIQGVQQESNPALQEPVAHPGTQQADQQLQTEKDFNFIREELYAARMQEQREELEQLMAERHKLVAIQDQLQQLYQQLPGNAATPCWRGKDDGPVSEELPASASEAEEEPPATRSKPAPDGNQVTFQEPLETVASYDELYGRMRQQRMLREELRDKKKELENMMSKDRPRRHYFRNQDNQSDNVSFSNKSDPYSYVPTTASGEVTMATWGGSTADNLESIEEDVCQGQQEEDDGYPSDGLLQVEEEEEAEVESDDRDTYTIEDEYHSRARHNTRSNITQTAQPAGRRSGKWSSGRGPHSRPSSQSRQTMTGCEMCGDANGPLSILHGHLHALQQTLSQTQAQLTDNMLPGSYGGSPAHMMPPPLLLQLATSCQTMALQQQDSSERLRRLETALLSPGGLPAWQPPSQLLAASPGGEMTVTQHSVNQHVQAMYQCQATSPAPRSETVGSNGGEVLIQTIQAADQRLSPLPLEALRKQRPHKSGVHDRMTHNRMESNLVTKNSSKSTNSKEAVIGRKFVTPSRSTAAHRLASRQQAVAGPSARPGLSAGISGTSFDTTSLSSYMSSVPGGPTAHTSEKQAPVSNSAVVPNNHRESDSGDFSLFEALRDTIYSEVATLISQNENRPHFLIELFREMQLLSNDYLRQRALYAIQDLVTKQLTDDDVPARNASVVQALKNLRPAPAAVVPHCEPVQPDTFDYVESLETASSMSTPNSSTCVGDTPFAKESLGDTVIHLDKALQKMREYEQRLIELDAKDGTCGTPSQPAPPPASQQDTESVASSSAADQASQSSASDFPQSPRIDTQQLDHQIKTIMTQIIPVLKEHMADVCSQQLLQYIRRLVLSLTRQKDNTHEFVRFFHKQLGSILQDSLTKFEGLKMRDCGEDLLVELSEILFNELAFFRLMQDLDDPKARVKDSIRKWRQGSQTSTETGGEKDEESVADNSTEASETEGDLSDDDASEEEEEEDGDKDINEAATESEDEGPDVRTEEENLGKARDDELAARMDIVEQDEDSESPAKKDVSIMLAPSETKPYTRIGSDEDDEGEDEVQSAEDPSDTAVSRDVASEGSRLMPPGMSNDRGTSPSPSYEDDFEPSQESGDAEEVEEDLVVENMDGSIVSVDSDAASEKTETSDEANITVLPQPTVNGVNGVQETPIVINGERAVSLEAAAALEEEQTSGVQAVIKSMEVPSELAGDPAGLKQPGS